MYNSQKCVHKNSVPTDKVVEVKTSSFFQLKYSTHIWFLML